MMTRLLFWYFAHPLVYFWLLPAFVIWYLVVPRILDVHVFGDSAARIAFLLLLMLSMPLGIHHQFEDPAIKEPVKMIVSIMTLAVVVPSLMTAFAMFGTFENYAAKKGIRNFVGIVRSLPWHDPTFLGCALAMALFILGGFGGIVQGSYTMNELVHNTMFIPGHIHATVAGPVGLTFIAASYILIPALLKRRQPNRLLAVAQCWFYFAGFLVMTISMHVQGLMGDPRRVSFPYYGAAPIAQSWEPWSIAAAAGGCIIYVSVILYFVAFVQMCFGARDADAAFEFATPDDTYNSPMILERLSLWTGAAIVLILIAYVDPLLYQWHIVGNPAAGLRTW
jgi:cytochrome c oxidase subunit 1